MTKITPSLMAQILADFLAHHGAKEIAFNVKRNGDLHKITVTYEYLGKEADQ